jgi:uncharacterized repeat protein (TIGR01451 family)
MAPFVGVEWDKRNNTACCSYSFALCHKKIKRRLPMHRYRSIFVMGIIGLSICLTAGVLSAARASQSVAQEFQQFILPEQQSGIRDLTSLPSEAISLPLDPTPSSSPLDRARLRSGRWLGGDTFNLPEHGMTSGGLPIFAMDGFVSEGYAPMAADSNPPLPGETDLVVCMSTERAWGMVNPDETVTITVNSQQMGANLANHLGYFWTTLYDSNGNRPGLGVGDNLVIYHDGVSLSSITLREIDGQINPFDETVTGTIGGSVFPISVTVYIPLAEPSLLSYSQTVNTDVSGNFTADFSAVFDLMTWDEATVGYIENGVEVHRHVYPPPGLMVRPWPYNWVFGIAPLGTPVTVSVYLSDNTSLKTEDTVTADANSGFFWSFLLTDVVESDIVYAEIEGGEVMSRTVDKLTMWLDAENDRITGEAEPNVTVRAEFDGLTPFGWKLYTLETTADTNGVYTVELGGVTDIMPGQTAAVVVADDEGDELNTRTYAPTIEVHQTWDEVYGRAASQSGEGLANQTVTLTVYSALSDTISQFSTQMDWSGYYEFTGKVFEMPDITPGDLLTVNTSIDNWQGVVAVKPITVEADLENDRFTGSVEPPSNRVELSVWNWFANIYPVAGYFELKTTASSPFSATPAGFNVDYNQAFEVSHRTEDDYINRVYHETGGFGVFLRDNAVVANLAPAGSAFTITLSDSGGEYKAQLTGVSNPPTGDIGWQDFWSTNENILPGDWVQVQSSAGYSQSLQIPDLQVNADLEMGLIFGQAPPDALLMVNSDTDGDGFVPTDGEGNFSVAAGELQEVWGDGDIQAGDSIWIEYDDANRNWVLNNVAWPWVRVNYSHDWVGVDYEAGHTFWITVTDSSGEIKGKTSVDSTPGGGWGGAGFQTEWEDWLLTQPDIQVGDWVNFHADDDYTNTVHVGSISENVDFGNNILTGTLDADWFTQTLAIRCEVWVDEAPDGIDTSANPNGGDYTCDFGNDVGYDLQPGEDIMARYIEPDGDSVINVYPMAKPNLRIEKSADGDPAVGGNMVFKIRYSNDGNALAEDVMLTDTLEGMSYLSDTSGFSGVTDTIPGGETVAFDLGSVPANSFGAFLLYAQVTAGESERITNTARLATSNAYEEGDESELVAEWSGQVTGNATYLDIEKGSWSGNPVPGTAFVYALNACNSGSTHSTALVLTDTLPLSTTLMSWWGQYPGWTEVLSSSHQLVLSMPALAASQCNEAYIKVELSDQAWDGMPFTNTATISSSSDLNPGNNETDLVINAGNPRDYMGHDLSLTKEWYRGELVPGGEMYYEFTYRNQGNAPVSGVRITSTLPVSTTYLEAFFEDEYVKEPVTPSVVTDDYVVWDIGSLGEGMWGRINLHLGIDWLAPPGTVLTHDVRINSLPDEYDTEDNQIEWVDTLNDYGPNLKVDKQTYKWNGDGQLEDEIHIFNLGSELLEGFWITDTYPLSTSLSNWWVGHGVNVTFTHNASERQLVWWIERMYPGDNANIIYQVDLDSPYAGQQGLAFTNQVEAPIPGDVVPEDNSDQLTVYTGPDVFVEKWLSGGEIEPGQLVTFTVRFGNSALQPWNTDTGVGSFITDSLPAEMSYVRASAPWDWDQTWDPGDPDSKQLEWGWDTMWADSTWIFELVAQIRDTVQGGDAFTNTIEAYSENPGDLDLDWGNNVSQVPMLVINPNFSVSKVYESSRIAGTPVTYTLTVTNSGNEDASNILLTDTLPSLVDYVGGGSYTPGTHQVSWNIASLAQAGGVGTKQFYGTLACIEDGSVENQQYRVASSDQGAFSLDGPAIIFNILAPSLTAGFDQSATSITTGDTVYFTSTSTTDGSSLTFDWDFGDSDFGSGATTSHQYSMPGKRTIALTITDGCSYTDTITSTVTVNTYLYLPVVMKNYSSP